MKLPAGTQVIDATGKWVTPGIVAGFSRLGLADVDLSARAAPNDTDAPNGAVQRRARRRARDQSARHDDRRQSRRRRYPRARRAQAGKSIFAGQGAVIDTGADMDPITAARKFQFVELGETGADKAGGSRASAHVLFRNALREAAELRPLCAAIQSRRGGRADERDRPVVRNPNESRVYGPTRGAARTCC